MDAVLNWLWQGGVVAVALRSDAVLAGTRIGQRAIRGVLGRRAVRDRLARTAITPPDNNDSGVTRRVSRNRQRGDCLAA